MAVCSSCSVDVGGKRQHVIKEEGFDGSESLHDKLISLDLSQRAAGRKLIPTDGVPKMYTHRSHGQMFLCVVGERMSGPTSERHHKRMSRAQQMLSGNIIQSGSSC